MEHWRNIVHEEAEHLRIEQLKNKYEGELQAERDAKIAVVTRQVIH
jgi:hypothetical protein